MRCVSRALPPTLLGLLLLATPIVEARPPERSRLRTAGESELRGAVAGPGLSAASQDTTWFGGTRWDAVDGRWEAVQDSVWTFDSGVGSDFDFSDPAVDPFKDPSLHAHMEGWIGIDNRRNIAAPYFRRLSESEAWDPVPCVGNLGGLGGDWSMWCGVLPAEADFLCYAAGQGYGNQWALGMEKEFSYDGSGSALLAYDYRIDSEPGFDYVYVDVDTSNAGDWVNVRTYTGNLTGSETLSLSAGFDLPAAPGTVRIRFQGVSDGAYSDEDGLQPSQCGLGGFDNVRFAGGLLDDFETGDDGWSLSPEGPTGSGDWSNLVALADLPAPATSCNCGLEDSVLVFEDLQAGGHNLYQDNMAASPWIDLAEAGRVGAPVKLLRYDVNAELPLPNYIFVQMKVQWFPETCPGTGLDVVSEFTSNGYIYYFGGVPVCESSTFDYSAVIGLDAQEVRVAVGVLSYCRFFGNCTGIVNSTPWFDNVRFGTAGYPDAPVLSALETDLPQDSFPDYPGGLGALDCRNGDRFQVRGADGGAEVRVQFALAPGPTTSVDSWLTSHTYEGSWLGLDWYSARMDTAAAGVWEATYHEDDPNRSPYSFLNDIFPENLRSGSRLMLFYKARFDGSDLPATGVWSVFPDTTGGNCLEMEVLPSSFEQAVDANPQNCILYVNHTGEEADRERIEAALATVLPWGGENFEDTTWDRFDVRAPSSGPWPFPNSGAIKGYETIIWDSGDDASLNLTESEAHALRYWLWGGGNLYVAGDNLAQSMTLEAVQYPSPRLLLEYDLGVAWTCGAVRDASCPGMPAVQDTSSSLVLDPVGGYFVGNSGSGSVIVQDDPEAAGCPPSPNSRTFDLLGFSTNSPSTPLGNENYLSTIKGPLSYASVASLGNQRAVVDGASLGSRRDADGVGTLAIADRLQRVIDWMVPWGSCAVSLDVPDPPGTPPPTRTRLAPGHPNPYRGLGVVTFAFDLAHKGRVRIEVYDVAGRLVRTLADEIREPGVALEITWDATDDRGQRVAPGLYFTRLTAGGSEDTRKLVILGE